MNSESKSVIYEPEENNEHNMLEIIERAAFIMAVDF